MSATKEEGGAQALQLSLTITKSQVGSRSTLNRRQLHQSAILHIFRQNGTSFALHGSVLYRNRPPQPSLRDDLPLFASSKQGGDLRCLKELNSVASIIHRLHRAPSDSPAPQIGSGTLSGWLSVRGTFSRVGRFGARTIASQRFLVKYLSRSKSTESVTRKLGAPSPTQLLGTRYTLR